MKKCLICGLAIVFLATAAVALVFSVRSANAQVGKGLNGAHYNLNIIGVPKGKTADMTNTSGHTIFVPLEGTVKIYYVAGSQFQVLDRNGTDGDGATVEVPSDPGGTSVCYDVYATALGKPNGNALVQATCIIEGLIGTCEDALQLSSFTVTRSKGNPKPENISDIFRASGCVDSNASGSCDKGDTMFKNVWIFNVPQLTEYFWDYTNTDLKLMQVRFYPTVGGCGTIQTVQ